MTFVVQTWKKCLKNIVTETMYRNYLDLFISNFLKLLFKAHQKRICVMVGGGTLKGTSKDRNPLNKDTKFFQKLSSKWIKILCIMLYHYVLDSVFVQQKLKNILNWWWLSSHVWIVLSTVSKVVGIVSRMIKVWSLTNFVCSPGKHLK